MKIDNIIFLLVRKLMQVIFCIAEFFYFHSSEEMALDIKRELALNKAFHCDICDYTGNTNKLLKKHIDYVHKEIVHKCDACEFVSSRLSNIKTHTEKVHIKLQYPCNHCDFKTTTKPSLKVHQEALHLGVT